MVIMVHCGVKNTRNITVSELNIAISQEVDRTSYFTLRPSCHHVPHYTLAVSVVSHDPRWTHVLPVEL